VKVCEIYDAVVILEYPLERIWREIRKFNHQII
jgi:hypothetical protein